MQKIKSCPFCGGEMIGTNGHPICHYNPDCIIHDESVPQELLDLLADTKKKLDIAVDALKWIDETYELGMGYEAAIREKCQFALEQIKDNDKDVK